MSDPTPTDIDGQPILPTSQSVEAQRAAAAPAKPAETPNAWISDPKVRKAIYGVAAAVGGVLVVLGVVTQDEVNAWLELAGNLVLVGAPLLALVNTPKRSS